MRLNYFFGPSKRKTGSKRHVLFEQEIKRIIIDGSNTKKGGKLDGK